MLVLCFFAKKVFVLKNCPFVLICAKQEAFLKIKRVDLKCKIGVVFEIITVRNHLMKIK